MFHPLAAGIGALRIRRIAALAVIYFITHAFLQGHAVFAWP